MSRTIALVLIILSMIVSGCGSTPNNSGPDFTPIPQLGEQFLLGEGGTLRVEPVVLTFDSVSNDSRCPDDVTCNEEGSVDAIVNITVDGVDHGPVTLTLNGRNRETRQAQAYDGGYIVRLIQLDPYPMQSAGATARRNVATFIVGKASTAQQTTYQPVSADYDGVIVPEGDAPGAGLQADGYWTPSERDIAAFEAGIGPFLRQSAPQRSPDLWQRQSTYKRQYAGIVRAGHRLIYASFLCNVDHMEWQTQFVQVADGGDCFFQVTYDSATGAYGNLIINGEA